MGSTDSTMHKNSRKRIEMKKTKSRNQPKRPQTSNPKHRATATSHVAQRRHSDASSSIVSKPISKLNPKSRSVNDTDQLWESFYGKQQTIVTHKSPIHEMLYSECVSSASDTSDFLLISSTDEDSETSEDTADSASHEYHIEINEISSVFNICLWNDDKIEEFLTLIGEQKYIDTFKLHGIKPNHLMLIDETALELMDIPIVDRQTILKERDCFIACNKWIQSLLNLNMEHGDHKKLKTILMNSKPILKKATALKQCAVVKFIANRIKQMENQLSSE